MRSLVVQFFLILYFISIKKEAKLKKLKLYKKYSAYSLCHDLLLNYYYFFSKFFYTA